MPASPSTTLYTLGRGILYIAEWVATTPPTDPGDYNDVGNCPRFEVELTEETLDHYSSRSGTKVKDESVIIESGYTVSFDLDEISVLNLKMFLKATVIGAQNHILQANTVLDREYALKFVSDNPVGPNEKWQLWRCKLAPAGAFSLIGDEWSTLTFTGEGLADVANQSASPYFNVTVVTTSTY